MPPFELDLKIRPVGSAIIGRIDIALSTMTTISLLGYIIRRVLATIPVMAFVALFVFSLLYIAPGDPARLTQSE